MRELQTTMNFIWVFMLYALGARCSKSGESRLAAAQPDEFEPEINFKNKKDLFADIPDGLLVEGINDYDASGMTPLLNAVEACHTEAVRQLLRGGANPNMQDGDGNSPLLVASERGYYEIASMLLEHRADVSPRNTEGRTALYAASQSGYVEVGIQWCSGPVVRPSGQSPSASPAAPLK
jgi:hypothetical protein